ncbi:DNA methyltransferase [Halonatronum saccharophilum]|uniref:DNA methyltransferase n=1 Tax=Halonatronum saccharophilum TaxID=150060 RepID=UPI000482C5DF|nr:DNA methyltransferase [Halonatronum saccharophilum]
MQYLKQIDDLVQELKDEIGESNDPIYNSHIYWAQKPFNITSKIIKKLTETSEIVFDPFMGSGVSVIESLRLKEPRKVIGNDINEFPDFFVKSLLNSYDLKKIRKMFTKFMDDIKEDLQKVYYTKCENCNKTKVADRFEFDFNNNNKILLKVKYKCRDCYGGNRKPSKIPDELDKELFNGQYKIKERFFEDLELIENSRISVSEGKRISELFTNRAIYVINSILEKINNYKNEDFKLFLRFIVASMLHLAKITDLRSNSQWLLWHPEKKCLEKNILNLFEKRGRLVFKALNKVCEENLNKINKVNNFKELEKNKKAYMLMSEPAQKINSNSIPSKTIDLIITDPPYVDQIPYSEYMQLYKAFLDTKFNFSDEIIISDSNQRTNKNEKSYFKLMKQVFVNMNRVLRNDKFLCMYFHDSNLRYWSKLIKIAKKSGFEYINQVHIYKNKKTMKNITNPKKSLQGDSIIFFIKKFDLQDRLFDMESKIKEESEKIIKQNEGVTTAQLYDNGLLKLLIDNDSLELLVDNKIDLVEIFEKYFLFKNGKWHIKNG